MVCDGRYSISVRLLGLLDDAEMSDRIARLDSRERAVLRLVVNGLRGTDLLMGFAGPTDIKRELTRALKKLQQPSIEMGRTDVGLPDPAPSTRAAPFPGFATLCDDVSERIAILGAGKIGEALVAGLLSSGEHSAADIIASDRREERLSELSERFGIGTTQDNVESVRHGSLLVIAVKPQDIGELLDEVGSSISKEQTIVSVAAGITTSAIERRIDAPAAVVRVMPNAPMTVHEGIAGLAPGSHATEDDLALAERLLGCVGSTVRVPEHTMDAVTAVSGSGPAYFALLAESMIEAGILLGLSRDISTDLVVQTMFGTAKMLRDEKMHPVELREAVTSPGGTTIAAIRELEQAGVRAAFLNAITAALERSKELAEADTD